MTLRDAGARAAVVVQSGLAVGTDPALPRGPAQGDWHAMSWRDAGAGATLAVELALTLGIDPD